MAQTINFVCILLETSENYYFIQDKTWMKGIDLTVTYNVHFWIKKYWIFKIKVHCKREVTLVSEIVLKWNYVPIVEGISNPLLCSTNFKMLFHILLSLDKIILLIMTLSKSFMSYTFLPLWHLLYVASIGYVNFIRKKTRYWYSFIIDGLIDNVNWDKFSHFLASWYMFYGFISIKFFQNRARKVPGYFMFTVNPFFMRNLNLSLLLKNLRKMLCFASTSLAMKHLLKYPNSVLSNLISSFISTSSR